MILVAAFRTGRAAWTSLGLMMMNRWTKSGYTVLKDQCHPVTYFGKLPPVGETTAADTDALEDAVASELMHHQRGVQQEGGLVVVGHDAPDEVGVGGVQSGQQLVKLGPEGGGDGLEDLGSGVLTLLLLLDNLAMECCGRICKTSFLHEIATTLGDD